MATVTAAALSLEKTLEELITEFNNLRSDVSTVTLESLISAASSSVVFEGDTDDSYETTLTVVDPTADRTITLPNVTGTVVTTANAGAGATTTTFADLDQFLINDGGVLKKMSLTTVLSSLPALLPASANANALGSASLEWSDLFLGDGAVISLGNSQDVTLTHVADVGLTITHVGTGDNLPIVLQLKSEENAITVNEVIASIEFAAGDSDGTDGATVAAGIHAIAEGTFAADANATKLVFTTGVSETAASSATAKMTLSSAGLLTLADDLILKDAATIGVTSSTSAIGIASTGIVTFVDDILIKDVGTIGSATTPAAVTIAANGGITLSGTLGVGAITTTGAFKGADGYTIGNASVAAVMTLASSGIVTFADDIILKDTATIGVTSSTSAISIAATGIVTFIDDIVIKDAGTIGSASLPAAVSISAAGIVGFSAGTEASATGTASVTLVGGLGVAKDVWLGNDVILDSDGAVLHFGDSQEVTLTHVADVGLTMTHVGTGDNLPMVLQLKSEEDAIVAAEVIASLEFAAGDTDGTDGATVAAGIHAIAEGTFSDTANATKLVFTTGVSETAASSATAKMTLSSAGLLTIADDFMMKDDGTIGVASVNDAITIDSSGNVTIAQNLTVTGTTTQVDTVTMNAANAVLFEGATADDFETTLTITDPTADRTITLPDVTGTVITNANADTPATSTTIGDVDHILFNDGGVAKKMTLANLLGNATGPLLPGSADGFALGSASLEWSDLFLADGSIIYFGDNQDVTLTHVADVGLTITHVGTGDNLPVILQLKSEENAIVAAEVIASIEFAAGDDSGTDAAVVAAGIHAIAEGTFAGDANATKLVFTTGVSETANSAATAKMTLSSAGLLTIADDLIIKNAGTIGTAADDDLLTMGNGNLTVAGTVTATAGATLLIKNAAGSTLKTIKGMT